MIITAINNLRHFRGSFRCLYRSIEHLPCIERKPQRQETLQKRSWTPMANLTHHIHRPLQPNKAAFHIQIRP
jgi:hypothetical protein